MLCCCMDRQSESVGTAGAIGPGHSAEEFRRRAGLSSRNRKSWTRVIYHGLLTLIFLPDSVFSSPSSEFRMLAVAEASPAGRDAATTGASDSTVLKIFWNFRRCQPWRRLVDRSSLPYFFVYRAAEVVSVKCGLSFSVVRFQYSETVGGL